MNSYTDLFIVFLNELMKLNLKHSMLPCKLERSKWTVAAVAGDIMVSYLLPATQRNYSVPTLPSREASLLWLLLSPYSAAPPLFCCSFFYLPNLYLPVWL